MTKFKKGQHVVLRDHNGRLDERSRYSIRSCGKKQAILDRLSLGEDGQWRTSGYRGRSFYLDQPERLEYYRERGMDPRHLKTDWKQIWSLAGLDGWDAEVN